MSELLVSEWTFLFFFLFLSRFPELPGVFPPLLVVLLLLSFTCFPYFLGSSPISAPLLLSTLLSWPMVMLYSLSLLLHALRFLCARFSTIPSPSYRAPPFSDLFLVTFSPFPLVFSGFP